MIYHMSSSSKSKSEPLTLSGSQVRPPKVKRPLTGAIVSNGCTRVDTNLTRLHQFDPIAENKTLFIYILFTCQDYYRIHMRYVKADEPCQSCLRFEPDVLRHFFAKFSAKFSTLLPPPT
jgi:hypothetical protein